MSSIDKRIDLSKANQCGSQYYVDLDKKIDLYDRVRCGLSHEYFIEVIGVSDSVAH